MPGIGSFRIWWPASTRSSTSDRRPRDGAGPDPVRFLVGLFRVVHPFPSALDAAAVITIALIAGASPPTAARLGIGMMFLQFAIGIANDLADASTDARAGRDKPLVAGQLTSSQAKAALYLAAGLGLISAASVGPLALAVAIVGFADGLAYDLRMKGTALSWAPFAAGIALLPVYSWVGATGTWPVALWGVVGLAVPAGVALALANSLADLERDRDFDGRSAATVLGRERTFGIDAALTVVLQLVAGAGSLAIGANPPALVASIAGIGLGWAGLALSGCERRRLRQAGWEVQAVGIVLVGAGWISALSSSGAFGR